MHRCLVLLCLFALSATAAPPTRAALGRAYETHQRAVLQVKGPHRAGPGVLIGTQGEVLTAVSHVGLNQAQVKLPDGLHKAAVVMANARLKVAVVQLNYGSGYPAPPVRLEDG